MAAHEPAAPKASAAKSRGRRSSDRPPPNPPARTATELGITLADINASCVSDIEFDQLTEPLKITPLWINGTRYIVAWRQLDDGALTEVGCLPLLPLTLFRKRFKQSGSIKRQKTPHGQSIYFG